MKEMLVDMEKWMNQRKVGSLEEIRGKLSRLSIQTPADYERLQYIKALTGVS